MPNVPTDRQYTRESEWIKATGKTARVGVTDHAQRELGDIVFVEVPTVGHTLGAGDAFGTVESVKAVTELYMPCGGKVTAVNSALDGEPETINQHPYDDGWIIEVEMSDPSQLKNLLGASEYEAYISQLDN